METPDAPCQKEVKISTNSRKSDVYTFPKFSRTILEHYHE
jgi:hypothetical protein